MSSEVAEVLIDGSWKSSSTKAFRAWDPTFGGKLTRIGRSVESLRFCIPTTAPISPPSTWSRSQ